jgi:hypothetical protein
VGENQLVDPVPRSEFAPCFERSGEHRPRIGAERRRRGEAGGKEEKAGRRVKILHATP